MSNTLTALQSTLLAWDAGMIQAEINKVTNPIAAKITPFAAFATRFDNVPSGTGTINVPIPTYPTGSNKNSFTITDATVTNAPVTLTTDYTYHNSFNPLEAQNAGLSNLVSTFILPAVYGIERQLQADAYALLTNFPTSSVKPTSATYFSSSAVTSINADLSAAFINGDRILVANSANYWNLIDNLSSKGNAAGAAAIQTGQPNNPFGMPVLEGQTLPSAGNLVGFTGTKGGIIVATAIPNVIHPNGQAIVVTSPASGLSVLVEQYYDQSNRKWVIGASVIGNVVVGNSGALKRIVSS